MIKAVVFDMDGLLVDSSPFWKQAQKETFDSVGVDISALRGQLSSGMREDELVDMVYQISPWNGQSKEDVVQRIESRVVAITAHEAKAMPGVTYVLDMLQSLGLPMAIASSSHTELINAVLSKLEIAGYFEHIASAEHEEYGKPNPAVFLTAARKLGVNPTECLVFEDSLAGVQAAKAAGTKCIAVPEGAPSAELQELADITLSSLNDFDQEMLSIF